LLKSWKVETAPMRYQPIEGPGSLVKDSYIGKNWTDKELHRMMRYYYRQAYFRAIPYDEFDQLHPEEQGVLIR